MKSTTMRVHLLSGLMVLAACAPRAAELDTAQQETAVVVTDARPHVTPDTGVVFGDSARGQTPPRDTARSSRTATGAGAAGNVPSGQRPLAITLERGPCMGTCPVYSLTVTQDGGVTYDGRQHVRVSGRANTRLTQAQMTELARAVESTRFFEHRDRYGMDVPGCEEYAADLPTAKITVRHGDRRKTIDYDPGCFAAPKEIGDFTREVDRVVGVERWTGAR